MVVACAKSNKDHVYTSLAERNIHYCFKVRALFFLKCYGDPRDLHSFPTRRSSDLLQRRWPRFSGRRGGWWRRGRGRRRLLRSEEHTSELQSQSNLVCRLLLEKKNPAPDSRACLSFLALVHLPAVAARRRRGSICVC